MRRRDLVNSGPGGPSPDGNVYEYVDMGLSVIWASFDIGATKVGEGGKFFQWGDIMGYTFDQMGSGAGQKYFSLDDYKYYNSSDGVTKYNSTSSYGTVDNKTVLESSDDAATFNMGEGWRMPTTTDFQQLILACDRTVETIGGQNCVVLTLKTNSSKKVIFPIFGRLYNGFKYQPNSYWGWTSEASTPDGTYGNAVYFVAQEGSAGVTPSGTVRASGMNVRGVWPKQ